MLALLCAQLNKQCDRFLCKRGTLAACGPACDGIAPSGFRCLSPNHIGEDGIADWMQSKRGLSFLRRRFQVADTSKSRTSDKRRLRLWPRRDRPSAGEPDTTQQFLETRVVPQAVHARVDVKVDEPVAMLGVGFLEVLECAVVFSEADMDSGEEVRRDVLALCECGQIVKDLSRIFWPSRLGVRLRQSCAHQRAAA